MTTKNHYPNPQAHNGCFALLKHDKIWIPACAGITKRAKKKRNPSGFLSPKNGGYLLSHLGGSIIGDTGLNFSVRNGKRWNPGPITT